MELTEGHFIALMRADPSDGPRLVFADWLDEQGQSDRAEFVRLQCALAQWSAHAIGRAELENRERQLRDQYEHEWARVLPRFVEGWEFHRGVIDRISINAHYFLRVGRLLFRVAPVRRVRLLEVAPVLDRLVCTPVLRQIRELDLCGNDLGDAGLARLARSHHLERIESLNLGFSEISDLGLEALARSPAFSGIRHLAINDNPQITVVGLQALVDSEHLAELESLDVSGNSLGESAFRVLFRPTAFPRLKQLVLHGNRLRDGGLMELVQSPLFRRMLEHSPTLDLRRNEIGAAGIRALAEARSFADVETLYLDQNMIGDDGLRSMANVWHNSRLRELSLHDNRITDDGCYALSRSPLMATLRVLDLMGNFVTQESQARLMAASTDYDWRGRLQIKVDSDLLTRTIHFMPRRPQT